MDYMREESVVRVSTMSDELVSFLKSEGVFDILCAIPQAGIRFGDLLERVRISRGTLNSRLRQGCGEGDEEVTVPRLWGRHTGTREDGNPLYVLTPLGKQLRAVIVGHGMPYLLGEIIAKSNEFDRQQDQILDAIREHGIENIEDAYSEDTS